MHPSLAPRAGFFSGKAKIKRQFPLLRVEPAEDAGTTNRHQSDRPRAGSTYICRL